MLSLHMQIAAIPNSSSHRSCSAITKL